MGLMDDIGGLLFLLTGDVLVHFLLMRVWQNVNKEAAEIKKAPKLDEPQLEKLYTDGCLPYVYMKGEVKARKSLLHSLYDDSKVGVMRRISKEEHKTKSVQGVWTTVKSTLADTLESTAFYLLFKGPKNEIVINVTSPESASFLETAMRTTHDKFETWTGGALSTAVYHLSGNVPKGVHEQETMLEEGTKLMAFGEVSFDRGKIELRPPRSDANRKYILTTLSKYEVIKKLENKSYWLKVILYGTSIIGFALTCRILYKIYNKWKVKKENELLLARVQAERQKQRVLQRDVGAASDGDGSEAVADKCVVCLTNPREIVLLNCGHLCICADCLTQLPTPLVCPICRQSVEQHIVTYSP